ncbi:WAT1-related protein At3g02690, chloroplastic-like isoform X2 [Vicia villosa]|uniref:WAT1-related protein At3g02690, chloroplastic-like isoform X2 n=1 Tax=Vicia villosa TaxID=3911 RepID=UPI00273BC777|nr:WAT1-related protein At3g02690, chloroplastic-like isoform X2 [Vicia villosa]
MLCLAEGLWEGAVLITPFFFLGTAMVAMKEVLPKYGPFFVSSFRLIPAGFLLVAFAASRGRPFPSGLNAWLSISLFAIIDVACFQVSFITQCTFVCLLIFNYVIADLLIDWFVSFVMKQGFLAEGLQKTSAGLGSVIIDSQPLTVVVLAALLFGESIVIIGATGLVLSVVGLVLLEVFYSGRLRICGSISIQGGR